MITKYLKDRELIQKLWQMFRIGQTTYVAYAIGLINFTLILYRLAGIDQYIEPIPFAVILIAVLGPLGIIIGVLHVRKQIPVETKIMAHHNPYIYKIVKDSKESMQVKYTMWSLDAAKVSNNFMVFQAEMNKKLWIAINDISGKEVFTKEDIAKMDELKDNVKIILDGIDDWKPKYEQLYEGKLTKDIPNAEEPIELDDKR